MTDAHMNYLLGLAYEAALKSPDPSTQNGAVIVDPRVGIISVACNTFPTGLAELQIRLEDRETKYKWVEHAERNCIFKAAQSGHSTLGTTMYVPWFSCTECARGIIASGIRNVIGHAWMAAATPDRWKESIDFALAMFDEAGVKYSYFDGPVAAKPVRLNGELFDPSCHP